MSGHGDQQVDLALERALAKGPADVLQILDTLRRATKPLIWGREGLLHAFLHRAVKRGRILTGGLSRDGLTLYRLPTQPEPKPTRRAPVPEPLTERISRTALRVARAVKDPTARGRVLADLVAHLSTIGQTEGASFGSVRQARSLLHRADRLFQRLRMS